MVSLLLLSLCVDVCIQLPDANSDVATCNHWFQTRRASSARIRCTPWRVLLNSPGECSRFPPKTPFGPENRGYAFSEFSDRECTSGGLVSNSWYARCQLTPKKQTWRWAFLHTNMRQPWQLVCLSINCLCESHSWSYGTPHPVWHLHTRVVSFFMTFEENS